MVGFAILNEAEIVDPSTGQRDRSPQPGCLDGDALRSRNRLLPRPWLPSVWRNRSLRSDGLRLRPDRRTRCDDADLRGLLCGLFAKEGGREEILPAYQITTESAKAQKTLFWSCIAWSPPAAKMRPSLSTIHHQPLPDHFTMRLARQTFVRPIPIGLNFVLLACRRFRPHSDEAGEIKRFRHRLLGPTRFFPGYCTVAQSNRREAPQT